MLKPNQQIPLVFLLMLSTTLAQSPVREKRVVRVDVGQNPGFENRTRVGVAVLVGIGEYAPYSGLSKLHYPQRDVDLLEKELASQRYSMAVLKDGEANKQAVLNAIKQAGKVLDPESGVMLFFFSGHGFGQGAVTYLATIDASNDSETPLSKSGLSIPEVERAMFNAGAKRRILWVDACRAEPGKEVRGDRSFAPFHGSEGTVILYSTKAGSVSYEDDELRQGLFSYYVLQGLRGEAAKADGLITFRDLADYVEQTVPSRSLRLGHVQVPYHAGESHGDFLLAKAGKFDVMGDNRSAQEETAFCSNSVKVRIITPGNAADVEIALHEAGCKVEVFKPDNPNQEISESVIKFFSDEDKKKALDIVMYLAKRGYAIKPEDLRSWAKGKNIPKGLLEIFLK